MDHNNDIGDLLKDRLQNEKKAPDDHLWDRINLSLEERDKIRTKINWYQFGFGGFLLATVAAFFLLGGVGKNTEKTKQNKESVVQTKNRETAEKTGIPGDSLLKDNPISNTKDKIDDYKIETNTAKGNSNANKTEKQQRVDSKSNKDSLQDDGYLVTTTYSYYSSALDTTVVANDKAEMDRLIKQARKTLFSRDSINIMRKRDSLK